MARKDVAVLLDAAAAGAEPVTTSVAALGADLATGILLNELVYRGRLDETPPPQTDVAIQFAFRHGAGETRQAVVLRPQGPEHHPGDAAAPTVLIEQDLVEAIRSVFGPLESASAASRTVTWPGLWSDVNSFLGSRTPGPSVFGPVHRLLAALDRKDSPGLADLAVRYGADKWGLHQYTPHYERHFEPVRNRRLTVVEIGVGGYQAPDSGGASLRMWKHYFPRAQVYGLDLYDKHLLDDQRITTYQVDQSDTESLAQIAKEIGPVDIVVDDGSHLCRHVIASFNALFPYLTPDGIYVVEDLQASYWPAPAFDGNAHDLADPATSVGFFKTLLDGLHHEEFLDPSARKPQPTDPLIKGVHFYHNVVVVEKGPNRDGSPIAQAMRARMATA